MWREFGRNWRVRAGLAVFGLFVLTAAIGPWAIEHTLGYTPLQVDYAALAKPPSAAHPFGTTGGGQDVLTQLIVGARGSVVIGLASGALAIVLAVGFGLIGGYCGGNTDRVLTVVTNLFLTLPSFAMTLIIAGYLGGGGILSIALIIGIFEWPGGARYIRSQALSLRRREFVVAAELLGENRRRIVLAEMLPHLTGIVSALFLRAVVAGIFAETTLDFLGIGNSSAISWGTMIATSQDQSAILHGLWWWYVPPGLCIALIGTATALVNFGIDEITDPKLRAGRGKLLRAYRREARSALRRRSLSTAETGAPS